MNGSNKGTAQRVRKTLFRVGVATTLRGAMVEGYVPLDAAGRKCAVFRIVGGTGEINCLPGGVHRGCCW